MATRRERVFYEMTATDNASRVFRQVEGSAQRLGSAYTQVYSAVLLLASGGLVAGLVNAAKQGEQSQNRLTAALKATGHQVGITRRQLDDMADAMAESTQFDDDSLRNAQGQLVKFGNIHGQVFRDAMKISADLAAFMGTDVAGAAQYVGRALQSPTEGVTLLERHIGKLTEAEEKHIKTLAAQGRAVEAQNAVLEVLQRRVAGTAEEMNVGATKATEDWKKAWDDLFETLGTEGTILTRTLQGAATLTKDLEKELRGVRTPLQDLATDSLNWLSVLRFVPGAISAIGRAAHNAQLQLDKQRRTVSGRIRNPGLEDAAALEAGLANTPAVPIQLGGNVSDPGATAREKARAAAQAQQDEQFAMRYQMAADRAAQFGGVDEALKIFDKDSSDAAKKALEDQQRVTASWVESAELATEASENMIYTWDEAGNRVQLTREAFEALEESQRKALETGQELGFTFTSAFEDAIIEGKKFSEVLDSIGKDIARIILRKAVTEPAAAAIGNWASTAFAGLFGGAKASGGPVSGGRAYLVGEQGPELFMPGSSGTIVPNGAGGVVFSPQIHIDARTDRAQVAAIVDQGMRASEARLMDNLRRGGSFARAVGTA